MEALTAHLSELGHGLVTTVELTVVTTVGAMLLGIVVATMRVAPVPLLRAIGTAYVEVFQNLPLLALLVLAVFALPDHRHHVPAVHLRRDRHRGLRGGVPGRGDPRRGQHGRVGQAEAARALGLTFGQSLRHVVLPQALRAVIQPIGNICIALLMNTVARRRGRRGRADRRRPTRVNLVEAQPIPIFTGAGLAYMLLALIIGRSPAGSNEGWRSSDEQDATDPLRRARPARPAPDPDRDRAGRASSWPAPLVAAVCQFASHGEFAADRWEPFTTWPIWRYLLNGLWATLRAAAATAVLSAALGLLLALGRLSTHRPLRWLAGAYVEIFRTVPALLLIYVTLFALPQYGLNLPLFWKLVVPLVVSNSAAFAEIFRAGILALDRGQTEAGLAVGLRRGQAMALVVLPQALLATSLRRSSASWSGCSRTPRSASWSATPSCSTAGRCSPRTPTC